MSGNPTADNESVIKTLGADTPDYDLLFKSLHDVKVRDSVLQHYFENGTAKMGVQLMIDTITNKTETQGGSLHVSNTAFLVGILGTMAGLLLIEDNLDECKDVVDTILEYDPEYSFAKLIQHAMLYCGEDTGKIFRKSLSELPTEETKPV
jgi:hypothetical protein